MGYLPGGRLLAVGGVAAGHYVKGFLALVDPRRGELVRRLRGHRWPVHTPGFSADGRLMATTSADSVLLWTLRSGRPVGPPQRLGSSTRGGIYDAALSPDGRTLAIASPLGVEILDVATLRPRATLSQPQTAALSVRFTPDGRFLAVGRSEGWTQLVSTESWRPLPRRLAGHTAEVLSLSTSPDGRTLATGSGDGTIRLFDVDTQQPLGAPLPAVPSRLVEPRFTPDGDFLFAITNTGRAYRWDVRPSSWARHACKIAGRRLTRTEWNDLLPGRDYAPAC
jgi:WD40 repeat protein